MGDSNERYWVRIPGRDMPWTEVPRDEYARFAAEAGFYPKVPGELAATTFGTGTIEGQVSSNRVHLGPSQRLALSSKAIMKALAEIPGNQNALAARLQEITALGHHPECSVDSCTCGFKQARNLVKLLS